VLAHKLRDVPLWIFHGDADTVAPVEQVRCLVAALTGRGSAVRYSELPGVGHNAWDAAYQSAEVVLWLFSQRRTEQTW
jgi:predicted peptidase